MKKSFFLNVALIISVPLFSQVGINTTSPSSASVLDVESSSDGTNFGGFLPPRVDASGRANIASKATLADDGLLIFFEDTRCLQTWNGVESTWENVYCMSGPSSGSTLLGIQDFEITPSSPELVFIENTAGSYQTGNGTSPNTNTYIDGRSYGVVNGDADVDFGPVDASSYSTASLKFRLASFSLNTSGNGADAGDYVDVYVSTDGGTTFSYEMEITGNGNATYDFSATGTQTIAYDGDNTATSTATPTGNTGISYVEITNLPNSANLVIGIVLSNNSSNELWVIDNVEIYGIN